MSFTYLLPTKCLDPVLLLKGAYKPIVLMCQWVEVLEQLLQPLGIWHQAAYDMLRCGVTDSLNDILGDMVEKPSRVCTPVWRTKEHDAYRGFGDEVEILLAVGFPKSLRLPQRLLDYDSSETVGNEEDRPLSTLLMYSIVIETLKKFLRMVIYTILASF